MRRAARRDGNEPDIIKDIKLWPYGASVMQHDRENEADLVVGFRCSGPHCMGHNSLMEVKMPLGPRGGASDHQVLSPGQKKWHAAWMGQVCMIRSSLEAWQRMTNTFCPDADHGLQEEAFLQMIDREGQEGRA